MEPKVLTFMNLEEEVTEIKQAITSAWEFRFTELFMNSDTCSSSLTDSKNLLANRTGGITEEEEQKTKELQEKQKEAYIAQTVQQQAQAEFQHKMTDPAFMANMLTNPQVQQAIMQAMSGGASPAMQLG